MENSHLQGIRALADGKWKEATACFDKVVLSDPGGPDVAPAYIGLLCARYRVNSAQKLSAFADRIPSATEEFRSAMNAAAGEYKRELQHYAGLWVKAEKAERERQRRRGKRERVRLIGVFVLVIITAILVPTVVIPMQKANVLITQEPLSFGGYDWFVLESQGGRKLLLMKDILEKQRPYNEEERYITWEECTLRSYLNVEFYSSFSPAERARIVQTTIDNSSNRTDGGNATSDYIFLLSLSEVKHYFPIASYRARISADSWMLRSPGYRQGTVMTVATYGEIDDGWPVYLGYGIRPAMWIKLDERIA